MEIFDKLANFAINLATDYLASSNSTSSETDISALEVSFRETAEQMKSAVHESTHKIIDKLESDKLEILISRIGTLGDIIRLGDRGEILRFIWTLRELVDYAGYRLNEGKKHWQGPFLAGKAVTYAALRACAVEGVSERQELERLCKETKYDLLDIAIPQIVKTGAKIPWSQVESFLAGTGDLSLPSLVADQQGFQKKAEVVDGWEIVDVIIPLDTVRYEANVPLKITQTDSWEVGAIVPPNATLIQYSGADIFDKSVLAGIGGVFHSVLVKKGDIVSPGDAVSQVKVKRC